MNLIHKHIYSMKPLTAGDIPYMDKHIHANEQTHTETHNPYPGKHAEKHKKLYTFIGSSHRCVENIHIHIHTLGYGGAHVTCVV